jgi:hypothetical protein
VSKRPKQNCTIDSLREAQVLASGGIKGLAENEALKEQLQTAFYKSYLKKVNNSGKIMKNTAPQPPQASNNIWTVN